MSSARSRRSEKSGSTTSIPSISVVGNINPASTTTIRLPSSTTVMFLPISPSPPRGRMRTGPVIGRPRRPARRAALPDAALARAGDQEAAPLERGPDRGSLLLARGDHREAQMPLDDAQHLERRLDGDRIAGQRRRLVDWTELRLELARPRRIAGDGGLVHGAHLVAD